MKIHPMISEEFRAAFEKPSDPNNTITIKTGMVSSGWPINEIKPATLFMIYINKTSILSGVVTNTLNFYLKSIVSQMYPIRQFRFNRLILA